MNLLNNNRKSIEEEYLERLNKLILERAFTGNTKFKGNFAYLHSKNEKDIPINTDLFFEQISIMIDAAHSEFNKCKKRKEEEYIYEVLMNFTGMTVISERTERLLNNRSTEYNDIVKKIHDTFDLLKKESSQEFSKLMAVIMAESNNLNEILKNTFNINKLNETDIIFIIERYIGKEDFRSHLEDYLETLFTNGPVMEKLELMGYINPREVSSYISGERLVEALKEKNSQHILKYLQKYDFFVAFSKGYIRGRALKENTTIEDLFLKCFDKKNMMDILEKKIYKTDATEFIWELYEKDYFTKEELTQIYKIGYLNVDKIVKTYKEEHKRKIALELNYASISDEKIVDFFTPEQVLELAKGTNANKNIEFFKNELKSVYADKGIDLERALIDEEKSNLENQKDDENAEKRTLLDLYKNGLVNLSKFTEGEVSEEEIINFYNEQNDDNIIIEAYNLGFLSQEAVLEQFENEDILLEKIESGLKPHVLTGYYQTQDFIEFYKSGRISIENLSKLKSYFDIDKIKESYLSGKLDYEDLFGAFVKYGIINYETANKINDKYDIELALEKLRENGGIVGQDIDLARAAKDRSLQNKDSNNNNVPKAVYEKNTIGELFNINNQVSNQLFERLGAGEKVKVCCKLFDGYIMVPFVDKKLALLEGDGRTYILPLKIVLEQVEHQGSENDLIGNATYRSDLYNNTEYVRTANHTSNWGRNVIKRMGELNPTIDVNELIEDNEDILTALEQQYKERKEKKIR